MVKQMEIVRAKIEDVTIVRDLFCEYHKWLGIDLAFQSFEDEISNLPGCYSQPKGAIFLAKENGRAVGCIAVRPFSETEAELKRLYIIPESRGKGYAKLLLAHAMHMAKSVCYQSVVLDTLPAMSAAKSLYIKYGFQLTEPYYNNPILGTEYYRYVYDISRK